MEIRKGSEVQSVKPTVGQVVPPSLPSGGGNVTAGLVAGEHKTFLLFWKISRHSSSNGQCGKVRISHNNLQQESDTSHTLQTLLQQSESLGPIAHVHCSTLQK